MRKQAKRGLGALILGLWLAVSAASSAAAADLQGGKAHESAAELLLLMLMAAAKGTPAEPAAAASQVMDEDGRTVPNAQIACAAPGRPDCAAHDPSAW
jgi:hypothetical protein